jgi:hypothetical protein
MSGGDDSSIQMPVRGGASMPGGEHSAQGVEREATTCFGMREKHGRGKGRRGCLSGSYELGRERTGAGTNAASTWRRRGRGGLGSAWHTTKGGVGVRPVAIVRAR